VSKHLDAVIDELQSIETARASRWMDAERRAAA
jgi:hypothetical protein